MARGFKKKLRSCYEISVKILNFLQEGYFLPITLYIIYVFGFDAINRHAVIRAKSLQRQP